MAGNFLDDIQDFLNQLNQQPLNTPCFFHQQKSKQGEAAYHDMANLFGFENSQKSYDYPCPLTIENNFGINAKVYILIQDKQHKDKRLANMAESLDVFICFSF